MITPAQEKTFWQLFDSGWTGAAAARKAGFSAPTAYRMIRNRPNASGQSIREERLLKQQGDVRPVTELCPEAQKALEDFGYFQKRYFGRVAVPWQIDAANHIAALLDSSEQEYLVINAPQGAGKSVTFTHDIPAWITMRKRDVRGLMGSATARQARQYLTRLKRSFERVIPELGDPVRIARGEELDAEATLAGDFGRIKPSVTTETWSQDSFVVEQAGGVGISEKEPTWSAYGRDGTFLGGRYDFVIWDDVVDTKRLRSQEQVDIDREWYTDIAESRLEPGGLLVLQGQRLGANDLYRYALDMRASMDEDEDEEELDEDDLVSGQRRKYHHLKYKAHYDELCQGIHARKDHPKPWPEGCLLYPQRIPWSRITHLMLNRLDRFMVLYQQEDTDPEGVLVNPAWVTGEGGHPGCWDVERDRLEIPADVDKSTLISVVTVDPSPTKYWAIEWWAYDPATQLRYLLDLIREPMTADKFLDYNPDTQHYMGIAEEWQATSVALGLPITQWIVEQNAAERFMFAFSVVKRWMALRRVQIVPFETHRNKSDPQYGVQTISTPWQFGQVRLPGKPGSMGRLQAVLLVKEATTYGALSGGSATDDCVMAQWFFEFRLPDLINSARRRTIQHEEQVRPSWLAKSMESLAAQAGVEWRPGKTLSARDRLMSAYESQEEK